ncbi:MAG: dTDP-4-amino-4,6-dideoxygalactose transaminase [Bacteroidota bacterium]
MIPFNKPYSGGTETRYIRQALRTGKISGNGLFTQQCQTYFEQRYQFGKCLLTTSCTDALEMAAMLLDIKPGDEVIMPSFTFVSTALAFVRQGATIVFADSRADHPGMDETRLQQLITPQTKAIVVVHYAGVACDMDKIMRLAHEHHLFVVEDAALAINAFYNGKALGSIGHLACFSFHDTKNIHCGEGGMLVINDARYQKRAEILWEKGTNRAEFYRGETNKYNWVDTGSSFLPSEINAAFLWAQIHRLDKIQHKRNKIWRTYYDALMPWAQKLNLQLPQVPTYAAHNAHLFYLVCNSPQQRTHLIQHLKDNGILSVFHYQSLHRSPYYQPHYSGPELLQANRYSDCLLRLPMFYTLGSRHIKHIVKVGKSF